MEINQSQLMSPETQQAYARACELIETRRYDGAVEALRNLLSVCPGHAGAQNDIGVLYSQRGEPKLALQHLTTALRLDPFNVGTMKNVADVCATVGMNDQAAKMYRLLLTRTPDDGDAARALVMAEGGASGPAPSREEGRLEIAGVDCTPLTEPRHSARPELLALYWNYHPRYRFLKTLRSGSRLLDAGAGPGGIVLWRDWLPPRREDIRMCAVDMVRGELFDRYEDFQICDLDEEPLKYGDGAFEAVLLSHVLEHIKDEKKFFGELSRVLGKGGRIYIEVPTPASLDFPSRRAFIESGVDVSTVNFLDDSTHIRTFSLADLAGLAERSGFRPVESGVIANRYLADELLSFGIRNNDQELATYGLWLKLGFSHYIVAERV